MTVAEQFAAAEQYHNLWQTLMPTAVPPGRDQFLLWAGQHVPDLVSRGINRAAAKMRKLRDTSSPMTTADAVRYASSVMRNEILGKRKHEPRSK